MRTLPERIPTPDLPMVGPLPIAPSIPGGLHLRAEQVVRERDNLLRSVFTALSARIAVVDSAGVIIVVNRAWQDFAGKNSGSQLPCEGVGVNYLDVCRAGAVSPDAPGRFLVRTGQLRSGKSKAKRKRLCSKQTIQAFSQADGSTAPAFAVYQHGWMPSQDHK